MITNIKLGVLEKTDEQRNLNFTTNQMRLISDPGAHRGKKPEIISGKKMGRLVKIVINFRVETKTKFYQK